MTDADTAARPPAPADGTATDGTATDGRKGIAYLRDHYVAAGLHDVTRHLSTARS